MAIGKTKRFEIFKRYAFTCQYCGNRPPDVILEVDHIHPRASGGLDEDLNLITACFNCNRGKRDRIITENTPRPDADLKYLETQQEIAEAARYLSAKTERDEHLTAVVSALNETWTDYLTPGFHPFESQIKRWLLRYSADEIETAIKKASSSYHSGKFGKEEGAAIGGLIPYVSAIMRDRRAEAEIEEAQNFTTPADWQVYEAFSKATDMLFDYYGNKLPEEVRVAFRPWAAWLQKFYEDNEKL